MPPPKHHSNLLRNLLIFLAAVIPVAVLLGPRIYIRNMIRNTYSPETVEMLDRIREEPIQFPDDWINPPEDSEEFLQLVEGNRDIIIGSLVDSPWDLLEAIREGDDLTEEENEQIEAFLEKAGPVIDAVMEVVMHEDYRLGLFPITTDPQFGIRSMTELTHHSNALKVQFFHHLSRREMDSAKEYMIALIRITKRRPTLAFSENVHVYSLSGSTCHFISLFRDRIDSQKFWKELSTAINDLFLQIVHRIYETPLAVHALDFRSTMNHLSGPIELRNGETAFDHWLRSEKAVEENALSSAGENLQYRLLSPLYTFWRVRDYLFEMSIGSNERLFQSEKEAITQLDLVRLNIANRIRELEGKPFAISAEDLVPEFFEEEPIDPFTDKSYSWDEESKVFYSNTIRELVKEREESRAAFGGMGVSMYALGGPNPYGFDIPMNVTEFSPHYGGPMIDATPLAEIHVPNATEPD